MATEPVGRSNFARGREVWYGEALRPSLPPRAQREGTHSAASTPPPGAGSGGIVTGVRRRYSRLPGATLARGRVLFTIWAGGPLASAPPGGAVSPQPLRPRGQRNPH